MSAADYSKQSCRKRPGMPYEHGDKVTNRVVDSILKHSKFLDKIQYIVIFKECGHKGVASHKTLTRAEISNKQGACRECLRLARLAKAKAKTPVIKPPAWPPHPDREIHHWAHCLLTTSIRSLAT